MSISSAQPKRNYFSNSIWLLVEKFSRIVSGVLVGVLVARYLGPEKFGLISYALNILAIVTIVSSLGLDSIIVREVITRTTDQRRILGTSFILRFIGSLLAVLIAVTYSSIHDTPESFYIVIIVSFAIVFQSFQIIDSFFQSQVKSKYASINQLITQIVSATVKLLLILLMASVEWFAAVTVLEAGLYALNSFYFYSNYGGKIQSWKFNYSEARGLLLFSWPLILASSAQLLYQKTDQILILRFLGDINYVGQYSAAIRISEAFYFIPIAISAAVLPGIIYNRDNIELQRSRFVQLCSLLAWLSIIISVTGYLYGDWIIQFLYKERFSLSPAVFKIHIWSTCPIFLGSAYGMWLIATNKQKILMVSQGINLFIFLTLYLVLIPKIGINGAALSMVIGNYFGLFILCMLSHPKQSLILFIECLHPKHLLGIYYYIRKT